MPSTRGTCCPGTALLVLASAFTGQAALVTGLILAALVAVSVVLAGGASAEA
jgi:hypothetical protein